MHCLERRELDRAIAHIVHTTRADEDLSPSTVPTDELTQRRRRVVDHPWCAVRQVHSDRVTVASAAGSGERPVADALITDRPNLALAVHAGDCVPVGFIHRAGAVAVAHAGWRGLEAGVLESTVRALRHDHGAAPSAITAVVGPHIRAQRYEFGTEALERLARRFGDRVVSSTHAARPALDLTAAVDSELERLGVATTASSPHCTAADERTYWSHRARGERSRIALVAWLEEA